MCRSFALFRLRLMPRIPESHIQLTIKGFGRWVRKAGFWCRAPAMRGRARRFKFLLKLKLAGLTVSMEAHVPVSVVFPCYDVIVGVIQSLRVSAGGF